MQIVKNVLRHFFPLAVIVTLLCGVIYIVAQQMYRMSANDPQIQMAEDTARTLATGGSFESLLQPSKVDISQSLAPFLVVYDDGGTPIAGNGQLHDKLPALIPGVFDYTRRSTEDRISWQPERGVRIAAVVVRFAGSNPGFVLAGRSLYETEQRIDQLTLMVGVGWGGTLAAALFMIVLVELVFRERRL